MSSGLSEAEARLRLAGDGANEPPTSRPHSVLREVGTEPMFLLMVACGAIYMLLGDRHEAFMLLGFVFMVISFVLSAAAWFCGARRDAVLNPYKTCEAGGRAHQVAYLRGLVQVH